MSIKPLSNLTLHYWTTLESLQYLGCWWPLVTVVRGGGPGDPLELKQDLDTGNQFQLRRWRDRHFVYFETLWWNLLFMQMSSKPPLRWCLHPFFQWSAVKGEIFCCVWASTHPPPELPLAADFIDSFSALSTARPCTKLLAPVSSFASASPLPLWSIALWQTVVEFLPALLLDWPAGWQVFFKEAILPFFVHLWTGLPNDCHLLLFWGAIPSSADFGVSRKLIGARPGLPAGSSTVDLH